MFFNGTLVASKPASYQLTYVACGGETSTINQGMGPASCIGSQYAANHYGGWTDWPSWNPYQDAPYHVDAINSTNSFKVSGNN